MRMTIMEEKLPRTGLKPSPSGWRSSQTAWATAWAAFSISSREEAPRSSMARRSSSFIWAAVAKGSIAKTPLP